MTDYEKFPHIERHLSAWFKALDSTNQQMVINTYQNELEYVVMRKYVPGLKKLLEWKSDNHCKGNEYHYHKSHGTKRSFFVKKDLHR